MNDFSDEDQEMYERIEHEAALRERVKQRALDEEIDRRMAGQADSQFFNETWAVTLKEHELDPQAYAELVSQDMEVAKTSLKESMGHLVGSVKKRLQDPRTGRFISKTQAQQQGGVPHDVVRSQAQAREAQPEYLRVEPVAKFSSQRVQDLKAKVKLGGTLTESELNDCIDDIFGSL